MKFSLPISRKKELLEKRLQAHEESEFEIISSIKTMEKMKRLDQAEQAQTELAQQRLAIESVKEQIEELKD